MVEQFVWIFKGNQHNFPSAVFSSYENAKAWIEENKAKGILTAYPLDKSVYEWAIDKGHFSVKDESQKTANFIANFSDAAQEHYYYKDEE